MGSYKTRYFGDILVDEASDFEYIDTEYDGHEINISLSDCNRYGEKMGTCLDILDKYPEINEIAKKAILENFPENEIIRYYFECHFDVLEEAPILEIFGLLMTYAPFMFWMYVMEKLALLPDIHVG